MIKLLKVLLFLYFFAFPFGQLAKIPGNIAVPFVDIIAGLFGLVWLATYSHTKYKLPKFSKELFLFLGIAGFSLFLNINSVGPWEFLSGGFYYIRLLIYVVFYLALCDLVFKNILSKEELLKNLLTVGAFTALYGLIQYIVLPDTRFLRAYGWDDHYYRLVGTFFDPTFVGIIIIFSVLLSFSKSLYEKKIIPYALGLFGVVCVALTYSRASYLALFAGLLVLFFYKRNLRMLLLSGIVFSLAIFMAPKPGGEGVNLQRTSTIGARALNYQEAIQIFEKNPLFGVGFNLYRFNRQTTDNLEHSGAGADSSLLFILATTGISGILVFFTLCAKMFYSLTKLTGKGEGIALLSSAVALGVHSVFSNSLFYPWVLGWILILVVCVVVRPQTQEITARK